MSEDYAVGTRAAFCDVTGQTNERSVLSSIIPEGFPSGHSVSTVKPGLTVEQSLVFVACVTSFVGEFLIRPKITTHLSFPFLDTWPMVRPNSASAAFRRIQTAAAHLVSITPEIGLALPALDPRKRADLRAEIDSVIAELYQLSPAEFGKILTTFPLLDRDQPTLPGDLFVRWNKEGKPKEEQRSYVTRDSVLLAYFRHVNQPPPPDLATWYRDAVGVNMIDDHTCAFRIGTVRSLESRVAEYHRRGAIAYIPSKARRWDPNGRYQPPDLPTDWQAWIIQDHDIIGGAPKETVGRERAAPTLVAPEP